MGTKSIKPVLSKKRKSKWVCSSCEFESLGYLGKCPSCNSWGTLNEEELAASKPKHALFVNQELEALTLDEIPEIEISRMSSGYSELDRVLGGGIVPGSLTLIGGSPGIGKSTLLLQVANKFCLAKKKVLYVSAEESSQQIKLRASRLELESKNILVYTVNDLEKIVEKIKEVEPDFVIVDSIQAIYLPKIDSIPGSINQIRETASNLMRLAKASNIPIMVVGHINKDGDIAGPKILEHIVDAVFQFEGEKDQNFRILRAVKNRFGSTEEIGLFTMNSTGLKDLDNPSELFLKQRSGGVVFANRDGNRSLLLELQSLILESEYSNPRRIANGIDLLRLHQILAILEKKVKLSASKADIYLNVVGGLSIKEPAADLAIALSIYLNACEMNQDQEITRDLLVLGELGLSGEVRAINNLEPRLKEAQKQGFKKAIVPFSNVNNKQLKDLGIKIIAVKNITEVIKLFQ